MGGFKLTGLGAGSASGNSLRYEQVNGVVTTAGDILYASAAGTLARLAIGAAGQSLVTNAAGTLPAWGTTVGIVAFTRSESTASGTQAVTGLGFTPRAIAFLMGIGGGNDARMSIGFQDAGTSAVVYGNAGGVAGTFRYNSTRSVYSNTTDGATSYDGFASAFDADGFTMTWARTGTPSTTLNICAICFR